MQPLPRRVPPTPNQPPTPFGAHAARWAGGCGSGQCGGTKRVCLLRGQVPADVLFVGEAPGPSESVLGRPFVGPAGQLLDRIAAEAFADASLCGNCGRAGPCDRKFNVLCRAAGRRPPRLAFTNVVGCIPLDEGGNKFREPDYDQTCACAPRFREVVEVVRPRLVVAVGSVAAKWLDTKHRDNAWTALPVDGADDSRRRPRRKDWTPHEGSKIPRVEVAHPAAVLRSPEAQADHLYRRAVVVLRDAAESL